MLFIELSGLDEFSGLGFECMWGELARWRLGTDTVGWIKAGTELAGLRLGKGWQD